MQRVGVLLLAGLLGSSVWLAAVDAAGRRLRGVWTQGGEEPPPSRLTDLALLDPRTALWAGQYCLVVATDRQRCVAYFERALAGNARLSGAVLGLAQLAEERGEPRTAQRLHQELRSRDRSFAVLWSEWNLALRMDQMKEFRRLSREVLAGAPPRFRGDFPLLSRSHLDRTEIVDTMLSAGSTERALAYPLYLAETGQPGAAGLLVRLLEAVKGAEATGAALEFVAARLRNRIDFGPAAHVWRAAVEQGHIDDRRVGLGQDPVLNPNPQFRRPFVPMSFDWSTVDNAWGSTSAESSAGGLLIAIRVDAPPGMPLLSKLVVRANGTAAFRIHARTPGGFLEEASADSVWQARDAATGSLLATGIQESPAGGTGGIGKPAAGKPGASKPGTVTTLLTLPADEEHEALFLMLAYRGDRRPQAGGTVVRLREVWFEAVPGASR